MRSIIKLIEKVTERGHCRRFARVGTRGGPRRPSRETPCLRRHQLSTQQIQIRQCEGREQSRRILREPSVAHFGKTPQMFDNLKGVLAARASVSTFTLSEVGEVRHFEVGSWIRFRRVVERAGTGTGERGEVDPAMRTRRCDSLRRCG